MTVRPTRPAALALGIALVLYLLTKATGDAWLALGAMAAGVLPLASLLARPQLQALTVSLRGPNTAAVGALVEQQLVVVNTGRSPSPPVTWIDRAPGLADVALDVPSLGSGQTWTGGVSREATRRGEYAGSTPTLATAAPFGLLRWERRLPSTDRFLVHPSTDRGWRLDRESSGRGAVRSTASAGEGLEVLGLRPWRPGDAHRSVSARASARHGRPVVLEREREQVIGPALLVLVNGASSGPRWEQALSEAASVALAALREGRPVCLVSGAHGPQVPRARDAVDVLDFFACLDRARPLEAQLADRARAAIHPGGTTVQLGAPGSDRHAACCSRKVLGA